jgi:hypothetical protein
VCIGVPFGHTRPQWILPYGGRIQLDGEARMVTASYARSWQAGPGAHVGSSSFPMRSDARSDLIGRG